MSYLVILVAIQTPKTLNLIFDVMIKLIVVTHRIKKWQERSRRHGKAIQHLQYRIGGCLSREDHQEERPQQGDHHQLDPHWQGHRLREVLAAGVAQSNQPQVLHVVHQRKRARNRPPQAYVNRRVRLLLFRRQGRQRSNIQFESGRKQR